MNQLLPDNYPGSNNLEQQQRQQQIRLTLDNEFRIAYINDFGCKLLGYSPSEMIGKDWFENFLPFEEGRRLKSLLTRLIVSNPKRIERFENAVQTRSGMLRIIKWRNSLIFDENGNRTGSLSVGYDVTSKHNLDESPVREQRQKSKLLLSAALDAQEKERRQIAEQLHENVVQVLTSCKLLLEGQENGTPNPGIIHKANQYLQQVINELRGMSNWLNPKQLSEIGLESATREMIKQLIPLGQPAISLHVSNSKALHQLHPDVQLSLFRIIQEQVSNIVRYAHATSAIILIHITADDVELEIKDDGQGFDIKKTPFGLGLRNIQSRTENHSGTINLDTAPGEGCTLSVCLPLDKL